MGGCNDKDRKSDCKKEAYDLCRQVEELMSHLISSMDDCTIEETEQKKDLLQRAVASMLAPFIIQRPPTIDLPGRGASVKTLQANLYRTRMEHGQKKKISDIEEGSSSQPLSKRATHVLMAHSKRRRTNFL